MIKTKKLTRIMLFIFSILLIVIGGYRGELGVVFRKAINICLECVGIG